LNVSIAYGKGRLSVELPDEAQVRVVEPSYVEGASDEQAAVRDSLLKPIGCEPLPGMVSPGDRVGIIFSDITRATPYDVILPPLLEVLEAVGDVEVVFFNATGTHRPNTPSELETILGAGVAAKYRIVQNDCTDTSSHRVVGTTPSGNEVVLLSEFLDCDIRIFTGFIEPHFFAGFSGGGKAVMPGLAGLDTIMRNHNAVNLDNPNVRWGVTDGNPLWEEVRDAAKMAKPTFLLNVALNRDKRITAVFGGDFDKAHALGCAYVKQHAMAPVDEPFDVVITGNSGYPLDLNMYQSVKGMSAAAQVAKPGGTIILAADCWDGIPEHGEYGKLLASAESTAEMLEMVRRPGFAKQDGWQAHIHALLCQQNEVRFYSDNLSDSQIQSGFMKPCRDIRKAVDEVIGNADKPISVCVLPEGPQTIPYVR
jgi:lactate racemase